MVAKLAGAVVFGQDTRARVAVAPGGAGGNTAAWLAREDVDVSLIARVGADEAGRTAATELTAAGIDCRFAVDPDLPTCCVVVLVAPDGDRTMLADRGANAAFSPEDVVLPAVEGRAHLHLSGYVLLDNGLPTRRAGLAGAGQGRGLDHVGGSAGRQPHPVGRRRHLPVLGGRAWTCCCPTIPSWPRWAASTPVLGVVGAIVVTHGRHGASWYSPTARVSVPAPQVHETDSTGAGDAFNAGLLAELVGRRDSARVTAGRCAGGHRGGGAPRRPAAAVAARPQSGLVSP